MPAQSPVQPSVALPRDMPSAGPLLRVERGLTLQRALFIALLFVPMMLIFEIIGVWSVPSLRRLMPVGHDFVAFWTTARLFVEGGIAAVYDIARAAAMQQAISVKPGFLLWHYPPVYLMLVLPLAFLSYPIALAVFSAGGLGALASVSRRLRLAPGLVGWALLFGSPVIGVTLVQGQNGAWFTAILLGGLLAREDRRPWLAAALFGLMSAKPHLAFALPVALVAARDWRVFAGSALAAIALALASAVVLGPESWSRFFANSSALGFALTDRPLMAQMPTAYAALMLAGAGPALAMAGQLVSAAWALTSVWRVWRHRAVPADIRISVLLMAALLVPPYAFRYDMVLTLAAALLLARRGMESCFMPGEKLIIALIWFSPAVFVALALETPVQAGPAIIGLGLWAAMRRARPWLVPDGLRTGSADPRE